MADQTQTTRLLLFTEQQMADTLLAYWCSDGPPSIEEKRAEIARRLDAEWHRQQEAARG